MRRKPVPPRVAENKYRKTDDEMREILNERGVIQAKTFDEAKAREHTIIPPKFTEKNLHTKRKPQKEKVELPS